MIKIIITFLLALNISSLALAAASVSSVPVLGVTLEEELSWLQAEAVVFSVAKRKQKILETASSVFVISQEDIKRSGVTSLPEALRLAPGVHVARINANQWAVSIHSYNERFSNKLLVLIDGRSVYSPLFSGVYWDAQEILLETVERIEVVRGSGAALWGSNAVNGVINVITKSAKDTQGTQAIAGYGTEEKGFGSLRYGGALNDKTHYRMYAKYFNRDEGGNYKHNEAEDNSSMMSGGFRLDTDLNDNNNLMVKGAAYEGKMGQAGNIPDLNNAPAYSTFLNDDVRISGQNILARWAGNSQSQQNWALQAYYDHTFREDTVLGDQEVNVFDLDFQHGFDLFENNKITWGIQYRHVNNKLSSAALVTLTPKQRDTNLYSGFISDEISFFQDQLKLTLASRFEHNDFTGFEIQPTARIAWLINDKNTVWGAISRSVRVPSISDHDASFNPVILNVGIPAVVEISGDKDMVSEKIVAFEVGYRTHITEGFNFDISAYYNDYNDLRTFEKVLPNVLAFNPLRAIVPYKYDNKMEGYTYGVDVSANWYVQSWWRLNLGYSYSKTRLHLKNGSTDTFTLGSGDVFVYAPEQMISLRSAWDISEDFDFDLWLRYVDRLEPASKIAVNAYVNMDARLAWQATKNLELSVVGQNLLADKQLQHVRDPGTKINNSEVQRGVYFKIKLDF